MFKAPVNITMADIQEIFKNKQYGKLPDPDRDYLWLYYPNLKNVRHQQAVSPKPASKRRDSRSSVRSKNSAGSFNTRSVESTLRFNFVKNAPEVVETSLKFEKGAKRARDLIEALLFEDHGQALLFSWQTVGKTSVHKENAYKELAVHARSYQERKVHLDQIQQKLKYLIDEGAPLLMENDAFVSFFHMVQNEIRMNGKDKVVKLVNYALDGHIGSLKKENQETSIVSVGGNKDNKQNQFRVTDKDPKLNWKRRQPLLGS